MSEQDKPTETTDPKTTSEASNSEEEPKKDLKAPSFNFNFKGGDTEALKKGLTDAAEGAKKSPAQQAQEDAKTTTKKNPFSGYKEEQVEAEDVEDDADFVLNNKDALKAELASDLEGRFTDMLGQSSGYLDSLPAEQKRRINALDNLQDQYDTMYEEYQEEARQLHKKFQTRVASLFDKRAAIVKGEYEPTDEECAVDDGQQDNVDVQTDAADAGKDAEAATAGASSEQTSSSSSTGTTKGIDSFWLTAMRNHEVVDEIITDEDAEALQYLQDVRAEYLYDGKDSFALEFHFAPNPFFKNSVIRKTYFMDTNAQFTMAMLDHTESDEIEWLPGKDLTTEMKKQRVARGGRGGGRSRGARGGGALKTVKVKKESFFNFFSFPEVDRSMSQQQLEAINDMVERDYFVGSVFKDRLVPSAVSWMTGEALVPDEIDDANELTAEELASLGIDVTDPKVLQMLMAGDMSGLDQYMDEMTGGDDRADNDDEGEEQCESQ